MEVSEGGNTLDYQKIVDERNYLIGRLFTLGGSILFIIGSLISVIVAYQAYKRLLAEAN